MNADPFHSPGIWIQFCFFNMKVSKSPRTVQSDQFTVHRIHYPVPIVLIISGAGQSDSVAMLMEQGAHVAVHHQTSGRTPVHVAAAQVSVSLLEVSVLCVVDGELPTTVPYKWQLFRFVTHFM